MARDEVSERAAVWAGEGGMWRPHRGMAPEAEVAAETEAGEPGAPAVAAVAEPGVAEGAAPPAATPARHSSG